jgi:hypothetical protein
MIWLWDIHRRLVRYQPAPSPWSVNWRLHLRLPGDDQQGIDIVATQKGANGNEVWVYQCKRYEEYTPGKLREALGKMKYPANYFVLMLSIPAKAALRQISDEDKVFLWDAKDIARKLKNYPAIVEDFFGAAWRKAFCGK